MFLSGVPNCTDYLDDLLVHLSDWESPMFKTVKALMFFAPVMTVSVFIRPFKLESIANAIGTGSVLLQESEDGVSHPGCFKS